MDENEKVAIEGRTKLEYYFLALVFTVLGLSIQTGHLSKMHFQYLFEIFAWVAFLISGLAGLSRMEWIPTVYLIANRRMKYEEIAKALSTKNVAITDKDTGRTLLQQEVVDGLTNVNKSIDSLLDKKNSIEKWCEIKYHIHKWIFVLGVIILLVSRVIGGINSDFSEKENIGKTKINACINLE